MLTLKQNFFLLREDERFQGILVQRVEIRKRSRGRVMLLSEGTISELGSFYPKWHSGRVIGNRATNTTFCPKSALTPKPSHLAARAPVGFDARLVVQQKIPKKKKTLALGRAEKGEGRGVFGRARRSRLVFLASPYAVW